MHVIVCAKVLTRRPAAQPGARSVQARARALPHLNLAAAPRSSAEGPSQSCCSLALNTTVENPRRRRDANVWTICVCPASRRRHDLLCSRRECGTTSLSRPHAQGCHQGLRRIAQAAYGDSLDMARALKLAVDAFLQSSYRARDVERGPHPLHADRGFPLRQSAERSQT